MEPITAPTANNRARFYGFLNYCPFRPSRIHNCADYGTPQIIETKQPRKRHSDCYLIGASDEPAAGENSGQPKEEQAPSKSNRQRSGPQKGIPAGEPVVGTVETKTVHKIFWEASGQRRTARRRSYGAASCAWGRNRLCWPLTLCVYPQPGLPAGLLRCSIKLAYQAADAGHPNTGRASSPPSRRASPAGSILTRMRAAKTHVGRALNPGTLWPRCVNPVREASGQPEDGTG